MSRPIPRWKTVIARFPDELRRLRVEVVAAWRKKGIRGVILTVTLAALVLLVDILRSAGVGVRVIDALTALQPNQRLGPWLLRIPGSLLAAAPQLPVWGSVVQILVVVGVAELLLGRRQTLLIMLVTQFVTSLVGRMLVDYAQQNTGVLSLAEQAARDTGPSAGVVALAAAIILERRLLALGSVTALLFASDALLHRSLAGYEHLAAVACGLALAIVPRPQPADVRQRRRIRAIPTVVLLLAAAINLVLAIDRPFGRLLLRDGLNAVPFTTSHHSRIGFAIIAYALVLLALSMRRGMRSALLITVMLLVVLLLRPIRTDLGVTEAVLSALLAVFLLWQRRSFAAPANTRTRRRGLTILSAATTSAVAAFAFFETHSMRQRRALGIGPAIFSTARRMAGLRSTTTLPSARIDLALPVVGITLALVSGWLITRPSSSFATRATLADRIRARQIVEEFGTDTLSFFTLRADKQLFFHERSVVAYAVRHGIALVSPDPVGPADEADAVWSAFASLCQSRGWSIAVLGASAQWLSRYEATGLRSMYIGDEAVVDCPTFSLEGGRHKALRQAVNRVANKGYTIAYHDPAKLPDDLRSALLTLVALSRRGEAERGFSMTLGRLFEPSDTGLLLAVCSTPNGSPVAFIQYVPAPGIDGWSLDVMRRDRGDHPNGLFDFLIVRTIEHVCDEGGRGLCLNFAVMRGVLAGEMSLGMATRPTKWALRQGSSSMQIESLWRYNAKFDPDWQPRYALYQAPADLPLAAAAMAQAEAIWELPVIGRFLRPSTAGTKNS